MACCGFFLWQLFLRVLCQTPLDFILNGWLNGEPIGLDLVQNYCVRVLNLKYLLCKCTWSVLMVYQFVIQIKFRCRTSKIPIAHLGLLPLECLKQERGYIL